MLKPLNEIAENAEQVANGRLAISAIRATGVEIELVKQAFNKVINSLKEIVNVSDKIANADYSSSVTVRSTEDQLALSVNKMIENLIIAKNSELERRAADEKQKWISEGIAHFSDILRQDNHDLSKLGYNVMTNLVDYLNINQGGLFLITENAESNEKELEMIACIAYNRKRLASKTLRLDEGLLGRCIEEKQKIYLHEIPENYIRITSGLGDTLPKTLLIAPLIVNRQVYGAIELAAFNEFEPHHLEFIEKVAESIAATISLARINARTAELLKESQIQADELTSQEEELRQNLEELKATQEESYRREQVIEKKMNELAAMKMELERKDQQQRKEIDRLNADNESKMQDLLLKEREGRVILETSLDGVIIIDNKGYIEFFNKTAEQIWGYKAEEVNDKNVKMLMPETYAHRHDRILTNYMITGIQNIINKGREVPILRKDKTEGIVHLSIIESKVGGHHKFTGFVRDLSREKKLELERIRLMENIIAKDFEYQQRNELLEKLIQKNEIEIPVQEFEQIQKALVYWNSEYSLGIRTIDTQHKKWIGFINSLYVEMKQGSAAENLDQYFNNLIRYTKYHFDFEEKYFKEFDYQDINEHSAIHQNFVETINRHYNDFKSGNVLVTYELLKYLRAWVKQHITQIDRKYVELFRAKGIH